MTAVDKTIIAITSTVGSGATVSSFFIDTGAPPSEAFKVILSIAVNHKDEFSIMHIDVSRASFHAKAQRPVLVMLPHEDKGKHDGGKSGLFRKSR